MTMQDVEKTTQALLKKFESLGEYEQRKIVFWYDNDKTADEEDLESIRTSLAEKSIKLHILNNNFFETKNSLKMTTPNPVI